MKTYYAILALKKLSSNRCGFSVQVDVWAINAHSRDEAAGRALIEARRTNLEVMTLSVTDDIPTPNGDEIAKAYEEDTK